MILPQFFLEFGELKTATNCTIKHSYTVLTEINEAILLSIEGYCVCRGRFSKIAAQSQVISLHELCWQDFLLSVIFERVRSRLHRQKKKIAWLACLHRTPTSNTKFLE